MTDTLIRNISHLVTFDAGNRELEDADLLVSGSRIAAVGHHLEVDDTVEVIDGQGLLVLPGLINAHQHLYQVGLRSFTELERAPIHPWLTALHVKTLYLWRQGHYTPEAVGAVARAGMVESLLGGVTTVADQHYVYVEGRTEPFIEEMIEGALETGIRLHAGRGSMTKGRRHGGVVPDNACQTIDEVLRHARELIDRYHDPDPLARIRVDLAPCGVHTDEPEMYREFARLAGDHPGVGLHTHLYEVIDTGYCVDTYDMTPWQFLVQNGWDHDRVWLAHMVDPPHQEIPEFAQAGVGIVHLIAPDLRMGWGLAPLRRYLDAGCKVGFGTTGSASNDGCNQLGDLRVAALAHRDMHTSPQTWPTARELLGLATRGSAACLNRPDLGVIEPGKAADIAAWDMTTVDRVGVHDAVVGLVLGGLSDRASLVMVNGEVVVRDGHCTTVDEFAVADRARRAYPVRPPSHRRRN
ncbi:amidohydrolase family protein [Candidatus Poriferisocius sp.]|uniref:amidohydrolase family protein n=1 Tax=Candidatus Poriferisocius sp. TaxID=3101276 RepID=UPI003B58CBD1